MSAPTHKLVELADVTALLDEYANAAETPHASAEADELLLRLEGAAWALYRLDLLGIDDRDRFISRIRAAVSRLAERGV